MNSKFLSLNFKDLGQALINAVFAAIIVTLYKLTLSDGFDIFHADWTGIVQSVINATVIVVTTSLAKRFLSDDSGKVLGRIG